MYPGESCPPSHVFLYIPGEASMQYIQPITPILFLLHGITSLGSNPRPQTLVFRCSRRQRPSFSCRRHSRPSQRASSVPPQRSASVPPGEMSISVGGRALHFFPADPSICRCSRCRGRSICSAAVVVKQQQIMRNSPGAAVPPPSTIAGPWRWCRDHRGVRP